VVSLFADGEDGADSALASRSASPEWLLQIAREYDRKGHLQETDAAYDAAIAVATGAGDRQVAAEALRRLAVVRCLRQETDAARVLCARSEAVAREAGDDGLVAEALNTAGGIDLLDERFGEARTLFHQAAALATDPDLLGRIEQNLATVASIQGDYAEALDRYQRSLAGFLRAANEQGCAVAYHNLGVISVDLRRWIDADRYLRLCLQTVHLTGDLHLRGLAVMNHAEALTGLGRLREARVAAETATSIFDELHAPRELADAYRVLGVVFRRLGELPAAQTRLRLAIEVASTSRCALSEAEATRELALVLAALGRTADAVALMGQAAADLERLRPSGAPAAGRAGDYPASVRAWGDLLAVLDPSGESHAERVAEGAVEAARDQGLDTEAQACIRVAAHLHALDPAWISDGMLPWNILPILYGLHGGPRTAESEIIARELDRARVAGASARQAG
jgi:tetratricopeptide (TPR) repeat protein